MVKKKISIILLVPIIISFSITLYGIYIIYSYEHKIKVAVAKAEIEISDKIIPQEDITSSIKNEEKNNNATEKAIGIIIFPSGKKVAIYNNPTDNNIEIGLGKIINNSLLNESGNSILLGHRDGTASELANITIGDILEIKTSNKIAKYQVIETYATEKEDPTPYKDSKDIMITIITCYPFVYVGDAPKRYVVTAKLLI